MWGIDPANDSVSFPLRVIAQINVSGLTVSSIPTEGTSFPSFRTVPTPKLYYQFFDIE